MYYQTDNPTDAWVNPLQSMRPESLDEYHVFCHFRNRPLFVQKHTTTVNLKQVQEKYGKQIMVAVGVSMPNADDSTRLDDIPENYLIRLCQKSFAEIVSSSLKVYAESHELAVKRLAALVKEFAVGKGIETPKFYLVMRDQATGYLDTATVRLTDEQYMDEAEMNLHYGEDFPAWHRHLVNSLSSHSQGITIFRGKPGTGKTTYLRKLMVALHKSHFFLYMPMKLGWMLSAPETIRFWIEQKQHNPKRKLVVILEDAEHFLMERGADNASSASDLLNASDGLLGNFLQLHLICTVNCEMDRLDKAVTRPGRMTAYREFSRLTPSQAQRLATAKNLQIEPQDSYSLAEIYNGGQCQIAMKKNIGFEA